MIFVTALATPSSELSSSGWSGWMEDSSPVVHREFACSGSNIS